MSDAEELSLREEIVQTCLAMSAASLSPGTSGNVSARWRDGILITPTGLPYDELDAGSVVFLPFDRNRPPVGKRPPSSEWRFHLDILESRPEAGAVVHTHSIYATALAILGLEIPAHHYMVAVSGGPSIRCASYATYGTAELSDNALKALEDRTCCLLANHGVIAIGPTLKKALWLAGEVETLAKQFVIARQIGDPRLLSNDEITKVSERFKSYGLKSD
jgi:L-fuculose-phosphate aldolase